MLLAGACARIRGLPASEVASAVRAQMSAAGERPTTALSFDGCEALEKALLAKPPFVVSNP